MSILHQMIPMFLLIQFIVVLVALVAAMLFIDSVQTFPAPKSSRRLVQRFKTNSQDLSV